MKPSTKHLFYVFVVLLVLYFLETALFGSYLEKGSGFIAQNLVSRGLLVYSVYLLSMIPQCYLAIRLWEKAGIITMLYGISILVPVVMHNAFVINKCVIAPWMFQHFYKFFF